MVGVDEANDGRKRVARKGGRLLLSNLDKVSPLPSVGGGGRRERIWVVVSGPGSVLLANSSG